MPKRHIKQHINWLIKLTVIISFLFQIAIGSESNEFVEGEHFKRISVLNQINLPSYKIESQTNHNIPQISIFFNYGCYGCWIFNKHFNVWLAAQKSQVNVSYYPVAFNEIWEILAKLYYVNKQLKTYTNDEMFNQIHEQHKRLWIESEMVAFYGQKQINKSKIINLYNSFDVARKTKNAIEISKKYNINITPNIIINFKNNSYMVNLTMVKDIDTLFKVIEHLIKFTP